MDIKEPIKVLDHGYIKYLDHMGSDEDIEAAARISYEKRGRSETRALIRYLMRHNHTSPFEMAELKFEIKMPIFVARQWVRHRTASMNEYSLRYSEATDEFYIPEYARAQDMINKQGSDGFIEYPIQFATKELSEELYKRYKGMIDAGISKELARIILPTNNYTKFVWKIDLHNLFHFLKLRTDSHAQLEIREYAQVIEVMVKRLFPISYEAWVDYKALSYTLSCEEVQILKTLINENKLNKDRVKSFINDAVSQELMTNREANEFLGVLLNE